MSEKKAPEKSYFDERMDLLGVTAEMNRVKVWQTVEGKNQLVEEPIFKESEQGIKIYITTLDRLRIPFAREGSRWKHDKYHITRLKDPRVKADGQTMKYDIPKGQGTYPFFHPILIEKFEQQQHIETLYLTEGFFKAFKGCMHGLDVVGVSSITHMKEKETGKIYEDIIKLIKTCGVRRVVWLTDGDCLSLTSKEITDGMDLYKRPKGFFQSANTFQQLLSDFVDVEKWFAHIISDQIKNKPKGLDDLLIEMQGKEDDVIADLVSFGKTSGEYNYCYKLDITYSTGKLLRHFRLDNVNHFYLFHIEKRPEIKDKEFIWNGTHYKWDEEKSECKILVPAEASDYFRVGDQYHEFVKIPNKYGELEKTFHRRMKGTIMDDHGREIIKHIPRYKAFCNVPDHLNYQQVIHSNFNIYAPFECEVAEEDCTEEDCKTVIAFLKHIFGSGTFSWKHPKTKEEHTINELDLGLDYIQLLYQRPTQILPILCLVSRENGTGKSTLAKLLKLIFKSNCAIVGNAELADNFNASWASKLLVICDEAKIDKQVVVERVKSLSTADKIMMNAKGKDHVEIDFFAKFLFLTNNEENFIYASDDDVRYWVRKVPVVKNLEVNMLQSMIDEIPAFLSFLNKRKISTENLHRAWFDPALIKTEALKKVIAYSMPTIQKDLHHFIRDKFLDFGLKKFMMTRMAIHKDCFNNKFEANYLEKVLKDNLKVDQYHQYEFDGKKFETIEQVKEYSKQHKGDENIGFIQAEKKYSVTRYDYPRWEEKRSGDGGTSEKIRVEVKDIGRPFVFYASQFLTPEELKIQPDAEHAYTSQKVMETAYQGEPLFNNNGKDDDLPF